jgi:hypothetical protein
MKADEGYLDLFLAKRQGQVLISFDGPGFIAQV